MKHNYHHSLDIPPRQANWGMVLLAAVALVCGALLILSSKASVAEAGFYTAPAWALVGVESRQTGGSVDG